MSDLINKYPYTDFHAVNLDYILKVVRENAGLHLEVSGNQLLLKTADNTIISAITIPYSTEAGSANTASSASYASSAGSASSASYASTAGSAATATNATNAAHAATADTATSATSAASASNADHATTADSATNATNAVNAQNAAYATSAGSTEHVENAIEDVTTWTNFLRFIKGNGQDILVQAPFSTAAQKDRLGNVIDSTYVASVMDDNGVLKFKNANGSVIASITPSSQVADTDDYGNTIAAYIKAIATAAGSNYLTITHGNGTSETILVPYSDSAWKDTNGNVIKNFYAGSMEIVEDEDTGRYNLVVYNGDTPKAELYRFEILAATAQEAEVADRAAEADNALYADHATIADSATVADSATTAATAANSCIFIQAYTNHDGSYSSADPDTVTIESITDGAGNALSLSDITLDDLTNIILKFHQSSNDPILERYTVSKYWQPNSNAPVYMDFDHVVCQYDPDTSSNEINAFHFGIGILNGSLASSECYVINGSPMNPPAP